MAFPFVAALVFVAEGASFPFAVEAEVFVAEAEVFVVEEEPLVWGSYQRV